MSTTISIDEAQTKLREIIAGLAPDEEVVIIDKKPTRGEADRRTARGAAASGTGSLHGNDHPDASGSPTTMNISMISRTTCREAAVGHACAVVVHLERSATERGAHCITRWL